MPRKPECRDCAEQIARLGNKPFYASLTNDDKTELADQLHRYGHERAKLVIDEALILRFGEDGGDRVPSASDLWALCKSNPDDFQSRRKPAARAGNPACQLCRGTGWEIVGRNGTEGARRCAGGCAVPAPVVA